MDTELVYLQSHRLYTLQSVHTFMFTVGDAEGRLLVLKKVNFSAGAYYCVGGANPFLDHS